jgi:CBS domain-containing protein
MIVGNVIERKGGVAVTISAGANFKGVANVMNARHVGALVVMNGGRTVGVISERDIVEALAQHGQSAGAAQLTEVLARRLISVTGADTVDHAMSLMMREQLLYLPVIENDDLKGIVSLGDIVKYGLATQ